MKVLIDINHPAHVHFFRDLRLQLMKEGHEVIVTASKKDLAFELLDDLGIPFIPLGDYGKSLIAKVLSVPRMALKMFSIARKLRPDIMLGLASSRICHAGFLCRIPTLVFTDTEHAWLQIALFRPFATSIVTPIYFNKNLGKRQIHYKSFHDLAYLHPDVFSANEAIVRSYGLSPKEPYFILRFVAWKASHDVAQKGISDDIKGELIRKLEKRGKVIVFSEDDDGTYLKYRMQIKASDIHHIMAFSGIYVGEGGSMATEAAVLGVPSILVNTLSAGVFEALEKNYSLLFRSTGDGKLIELVEKLLNDPELIDKLNLSRAKLLSENQNPIPFFKSLVLRYSRESTIKN